MTIRIGINGFGRIGRNFYRAALESSAFGKGLEIVAVNDIAPVDSLAYMLKWDSVYGKLGKEVKVDGAGISVGGKRFEVTQVKDPADIPWGKMGVEVVLESTGLFTERDKAANHLTPGVRKVLISAPAKGPDITLVLNSFSVPWCFGTAALRVSNTRLTDSCSSAAVLAHQRSAQDRAANNGRSAGV